MKIDKILSESIMKGDLDYPAKKIIDVLGEEWTLIFTNPDNYSLETSRTFISGYSGGKTGLFQVLSFPEIFLRDRNIPARIHKPGKNRICKIPASDYRFVDSGNQ